MQTIYSICGDPGGAAALAPVIAALRPYVRTQSFCYRQARDVFKRRGLEYSDLIESDVAVRTSILDCDPSFILLGTSVNGGNWELAALESGLSLPSLAILDFWSNYSARFALPSGTLVMPDNIAVMDEHARQEMVSEGFPPNRLIVTGQPAFDDLGSDPRRLALLASVGSLQAEISSSELLRVVFVSQPVILGVSARSFSKSNVLPQLVEKLEVISVSSNRNVELVIRPHPREADDDFSWVCSSRIAIKVDRSGDARDAVAQSSVVVGMDSALLLEACALGCIVLSIQLGAGAEDALPTNRMGLSQRITSIEEVECGLRQALFDASYRRIFRERCAAWSLDASATSNIVTHILNTLNL